MTLVIALFLIGILLLALEIVVPGAVLGIAGAICMVAGTISAFATLGVREGAIASAVAMVLLLIVCYAEFVYLPKSRFAKIFTMDSTVAGQSQAPVADASVVGQRGVAVTPLTPSGSVKIGDKRYDALCRSGHAAPGTPVSVVGLDNFRLVVTAETT